MIRPLNYHFEEGEVLLIDKPQGWSSFDVVKKIRNLITRHLGIKKIKVGHAGTLDPLATGLLICCTGKATKKISEFQDLNKEYVTSARLGLRTPSLDIETEPEQILPWEQVTVEQLSKTFRDFTGKYDQIPPAYSAKKIKGRRAYQLARAGEKVELPPKTVEIFSLGLLKADLPDFTFHVRCSKGTYIRSLIWDIGTTLNTGAVMTELRRTSIGDYQVDSALSPGEFEEKLKKTEQI